MTDVQTSKLTLRADLDFPQAQQHFAGHFPGQTIIPGAALTDRVVTEVERATGRRICNVRQVKFVATALPLDALVLQATVSDTSVRFELLRHSEMICSGTLTLESGV